ncbi:DNA repair protein UVH3 [Ceratobasidium theobromae]|uniref:DNA repair protein UVH3 n=1 Tax=Ceratobasidium theobromae TaxID=1582974 RepID=A0A5N5QUH2_9AGAM|nr:DNA repair protein UVH3 [Ceratobasidium theobromae]
MGVKQLWTLLVPVGRPVPLETLEGKVLAIDSSIWLYQFQATMRDKEGRALVNAHLLGFLRRISKLLFYGIKPVFVFDGGAPVLKRNTIAERKRRKSGAVVSHAKVAEKLLAAQLRRAALHHAEGQGSSGNGTSPVRSKPASNLVDDDNANYLEDLSGPSLVLPGKHNAPVPPVKPVFKSSSPLRVKPPVKLASSGFQEHDPYRLPELTTSIDARVLPDDCRVATDEEIRAYISHLRPDDPEFHELPTEAQYEILGELRLKSRTTSHRRLQRMLKESKTPMDFSIAQIKNLGQRNRLTQEVLSTLNLVGTGTGAVVPVKIAGEKNREYILVRNEEGERGFTLGIRQEGNSVEKPIVVEEDDAGDDSFDSKIDDSWEDVVVPGRSQIGIVPDQDWRDFKRENALAGLAKRDTDKCLTPLTTKSGPVEQLSLSARLDKGKRKEAHPPFGSDGDSHMSDEDVEFQLAVQASLLGDQIHEDEEDDVQRALALSLTNQSISRGEASSSTSLKDLGTGAELHLDFGFGQPSTLFGAPNGLLGGNASTPSSPSQAGNTAEDFEDTDLDMEEIIVNVPLISTEQVRENLEWENVDGLRAPNTATSTKDPSTFLSPMKHSALESYEAPNSDLLPAEPVPLRSSATRRELAQALSSGDEDDDDAVPLPSRLMTILAPYQTPYQTESGLRDSPVKNVGGTSPTKLMTPKLVVQDAQLNSEAGEGSVKPLTHRGTANAKRVTWDDGPQAIGVSRSTSIVVPLSTSAYTGSYVKPAPTIALDSDEDGGEVPLRGTMEKHQNIPAASQTGDETTAEVSSLPSWFNSAPTIEVSAPSKRDAQLSTRTTIKSDEIDNQPPISAVPEEGTYDVNDKSQEIAPVQLSDDDDADMEIPWSRSPTPSGARSPVAVPVCTEPDFDSAGSRNSRLRAEDEENASFMSKLQGKSYAEMRESLDAEIAALRKERAAALRDAEDVTAQMSAQIQVLLRLFGVPFVNAPMEAEAQCAFLAQRGLVEGVITDDSDVFLFGAARVFRNMFNQSKTVECFLAADLERELGLDRETLIGLAYLLGSDYTDGLPGVGPVVAMEIMKEFPGESGLHDFRNWWRKVQVGKDTAADLKSQFRKRFKKKFTSLHLTEEWPNPKVREAYLDPTVDQSEERFQWGLPDLDGLRRFLAEELSWSVDKIDETILPIIRRMTQRSTTSAANRQGTLTSFFDGPSTSSSNGVTHAPRKRQPYASKRLQQVVAEYRARKAGEEPTNEDDDKECSETRGKARGKRSHDENETSETGKNKTKRAKPQKGKSSIKDRTSHQLNTSGGAGSQEPAAGAKRQKRKRNPASSTQARHGGRRGGAGNRASSSYARAGVGNASDDDLELPSDAWSENSKTEDVPIVKKPRLRPRMKKPSPLPQSPEDSENNTGSSDNYVE